MRMCLVYAYTGMVFNWELSCDCGSRKLCSFGALLTLTNLWLSNQPR